MNKTPSLRRRFPGDGTAEKSTAVRRTDLPGGLRVVTEHIPHVHSASVGLWVNVG
ncbi:peptidase M16, partial [Mycobacterium sp. ITM-2017-0098]